ncbi:hypothetical protein LEP1GSC036_1800 [Leptospira weilii str. 2006001853]|uniref:Uncharacterized protein n=1 Tax=Leptospira weilii str. 2006001853 TaxID=1001589 RepID=A0A828YX78_9LEPT|nr:hypothetical protein LEP1GSC036_1800 [Leptospira weilii str. 2006001853]EMN44553.1 hypothetical protein LEP1GSC086_1973 [Leptospira weilii str. LNT 1234]
MRNTLNPPVILEIERNPIVPHSLKIISKTRANIWKNLLSRMFYYKTL